MPVHPHVRNCSHRLCLRETEEPGRYSCGGEFDEDDMVNAVGVEGVVELVKALDFVGFCYCD